MRTPPHNKYSKRRNVFTMANPSLSTVAHRCCEPRKVPLRNPSGSSLIVFTLTATLKLSRWDLRQETPPILFRSIGKHQHLIPVLLVRQSNCVGHQVLRIAPCSHLLALPCFLRDRPIRRDSLGPALNSPHVLLQQQLKGLDNLCQSRKRRPQPVYGLQNWISSPAVYGGACSPIHSNTPGRETPVSLSTPFHTTRSRYRKNSYL